MSDDTENTPKPRRILRRISKEEHQALQAMNNALDEGKGRVAYNLDQSERRAQQGTVLVSDSASDDLPGKRAADPDDPSLTSFQSVTVQALAVHTPHGEHHMLTVRDDGRIQTQDAQWIDPVLAEKLKKAVGTAMRNGEVTPEEAKELSALAVNATEPTDGVVRQTRDGSERRARLGDTIVEENLPTAEGEAGSVGIQGNGPDGTPYQLHISRDGSVDSTLEGCFTDKAFAKQAIEAVTRIMRDGKLDAADAKELGELAPKAPKADGPAAERCDIER
jgi:hypothetical protein